MAREVLVPLKIPASAGVDKFAGSDANGVLTWESLTSGQVTTALGFSPVDFQGLVIVADDLAGADLGAKINTADAALGATAGTILVLTVGTISTAVTISAGHVLKFGPGVFPQSALITLNGDGAGLLGAGSGSTTLSNTSTTASSVAIADSRLSITIEHIKLFRNATPTSTAHGLVQLGTTDSTLISNVVVEGHYKGIVLGPCGYSRMQNIKTTKNLSDGIYLTNTAGWGALQWQIREVVSTQNGGNGISVLGQNTGPTHITMGAWSEILTFANSGNGARVTTVSAIPIYGVRMTECFWGEDGDSEVYLNTYGSHHKIMDCVIELSGSRTTGPTLATAASTVGHGIDITTNNQTAIVTGAYIVDCSYNGIECQADSVSIENNTIEDNGRAEDGGALQIGVHVICDRATIVGNSIYNMDFTTQLYAVYSDNDTSVIVGNTLQGTTEAIHFNTGPTTSVVGPNRISGTAGVEYYAPKVIAAALKVTASPTTGHVLTSDADGDATWQAVTSGQVTTGLGYTPANRAGDTFTGNVIQQGPKPYVDVTAFSSLAVGANWTDAIVAALAIVPAGGELYFPTGIFESDPFVYTAGRIHIRGAGAEATFLRCRAGSSGVLMTINPTTGNANYSSLSDMSIQMANAPTMTAVEWYKTAFSLVERVRFTNGAYGIKLLDNSGGIFRDLDFIDHTSAMIYEDGDTCGESTFDHVFMRAEGSGITTAAGYELARTTATDIGGRYFTDCRWTRGGAATFTNAMYLHSSAANTLVFLMASHCVMDNLSGDVVRLVNQYITKFHNCWMNGAGHAFYVDGGGKLSVGGCEFDMTTGGFGFANSPEHIEVWNNWVNRYPLFKMPSSGGPTKVSYSGNYLFPNNDEGFGNPNATLTDNMTRLLAATGPMLEESNRTFASAEKWR